MALQPDMIWVNTGLRNGADSGGRAVFGVIREARVGDPGISAYFVIICSDGTLIDAEFVYSLNPCEAIGSLVHLEILPDGSIGARRFKAIDDMLDAYKSAQLEEERVKRSKQQRSDTMVEKERTRNEWMESMGRP